MENEELQDVFISVEAMKDKFPNSMFWIIGEYVDDQELAGGKIDYIHLSNDKELAVRRAAYYKRSDYQIVGYLSTQKDNEFVVVLESIKFKKLIIRFSILGLLLAIIGFVFYICH